MSEDSLPIETKKHRKHDYVVYPKCHSYHQKTKFVKGSRYEKGQRWCATCETWITKKGIVDGKCGCCHSKLRKKSPYSKKEIKTERGDRALKYLKVAMVELQNGCKTLHLYYKADRKLGSARVESLLKNIRLVRRFLKDIRKYKRQRHERIVHKYEKLTELLENTIKNMPKM